jgi:tetratricopeptide (TPR) repeat protein
MKITSFVLPTALAVVSLAGGCLSTNSSGDFSDGNADASSKLELPPREKAKACLNAGQVFEKQSSWREAAFEYESARKADPSLDKTLCRRLAVIYDRLGDFDKAGTEYQKALSLQPKDAGLLNDAGYSYYCACDWTTAERYLRQAVEVNPGLQRAWMNLGMTLAQLNRQAEAFDAFTRAVPEAEAHCNLAFVYSMQGKRRDAIDEYRRALELAPRLDLARGALAKLENSMAGGAEAMPSRASGDFGGFASQRTD